MKAPAFDYARPQSLGEAMAMLAEGGPEARIVAGGQSLLAMMNLRVASPHLLIDISRLPELAPTAEDGNRVRLGACITHAAIEDGRVPDPSRGLMPRVAAGLAYRAVRNRGTIGGSLALADPAAEWPAVLMALDAEVSVRGPNGARMLRCGDLATGIFETRLGDAEIIEHVEIPKLSPRARWGFCKLCRKTGEFAEALAVVVVDHGRARIVLGAANGPPLPLADMAELLAAGEAETGALRDAAAAGLDAAGDRQLDEFQRNLLTVAALRAATEAAT